MSWEMVALQIQKDDILQTWEYIYIYIQSKLKNVSH